MSDQATGGDGSVRWSVSAESVKQHATRYAKAGKVEHEGVDDSGEPGDWFTVSVKVPRNFKTVDAYLAALRSEDPVWGLKPDPDKQKRVEFNIQIERMTPEQVRVSWGDSEHVHRPKKTMARRKAR
jgi:hypothetical protein